MELNTDLNRARVIAISLPKISVDRWVLQKVKSVLEEEQWWDEEPIWKVDKAIIIEKEKESFNSSFWV